MLRFVFGRVAAAFVVLWAAATLVFILAYAIPADPARAIMGNDAPEEQVQAYRRALGLDQPVPVQYARYIQRLAVGDLGVSLTSHRPVIAELGRFFPATLEIVIPSLVLSTVIGVVLGVLSAVKSGRWQDRLIQVTSLFGLSMPVFWLGLVMQLILYGWLGWLPLGGRLPITTLPPPTVTGFYTFDALLIGDFALAWTATKHLILPTLVLTNFSLPLMSRLTRAVMLDVLRLDFIRTARSKGLSERTVTYRHALRNAAIPLATVFGLRVGAAVGGAVITETVFNWPGAGRFLVQAITNLDYPAITGFTLVICASYTFANFLVDISYGLLDPRIKTH
jgi:peptide/nickel transport system permease protein